MPAGKTQQLCMPPKMLFRRFPVMLDTPGPIAGRDCKQSVEGYLNESLDCLHRARLGSNLSALAYSVVQKLMTITKLALADVEDAQL